MDSNLTSTRHQPGLVISLQVQNSRLVMTLPDEQLPTHSFPQEDRVKFVLQILLNSA